MEKLKKKRGGHRARATELMKILNQALNEPILDIPLIEMNAIELQRQEDLILAYDAQAIDLPDCDVDAEISDSSTYNMKINYTLKTVNDKIASQNRNQAENRRDVTDVHLSKQVKLPNLNLSTFSGKPLEWTDFWELFRTAIHERTDLSGPMKFKYLLGQLKGEASDLLAGFTHSEAEYLEAVDLLTNTYGKNHIIIQARLNAILDLEPPKPTVESLSKFRSTYEGHIRVLKTLKVNTTESGYLYAHILLRKLPSKTRDNINRAKPTDTWSLDELRDSINSEIKNLEAVRESESYEKEKFKLEEESLPTAAFAVSTTKQIIIRCAYCSENHSSINCSKYKTVKVRKQRITELKLCYNCLKSNHSVSSCLNKTSCKHCGKRHHSSICGKDEQPPASHTATNITVSKPGGDSLDSSSALTISSKSNDPTNLMSILPTAQVKISNGDKSLICNSLLDNGSQKTFVLKSVKDKLKLETIGTVCLEVDGFGSHGERKNYDIVTLDIMTNEGIINVQALVVSSMPNRIAMPGREIVVDNLIKKGYILADSSKSNTFALELIIGIDNYFKFIHGNKISDGIFSIPSKLGTIISGTTNISSNSCCAVTTVLEIGVNSSLDENISNLWKLDTVGIESCTDDFDAVKIFQDSIEYSDGHYTTKLPWKKDKSELQDNKALAYQRTKSIWNSLLRDKTKLMHYDKIIREQLDMKFIELVSDDDCTNSHYIPHHCVAKQSATTPIRIVLDCSAKQDKTKPSLNECLLTGPSLVNDMISILIKFRLKECGVSADIEKAFHMVKLHEDDRNFCRFFWPKDPFDPESEMLTYRFQVVLFGATPSQFLLNSTILFHLSKYDCQSSKILRENIYVDNLLTSFNSERHCVQFYKIAKTIMAEGGFNLREWSSNSRELTSFLNFRDKCASSQVNALGLEWNTNDDSLTTKVFISENKTHPTKRSIVSDTCKTFDVFGVLLPITIRAKILIQDLWKLELGWDEKIPDEQNLVWQKYLVDLKNVSSNLKRNFSYNYENPILHIFADASKRCFGAVSYLVENENLDFVIAKSRLAPVKAPTLPQLELTAVELAARLAQFLKNIFFGSLNLEEVYIWTDSEIVLSWIKSSNPSNKRPYVTKRLESIRKLAPFAKFCHVSGVKNVADLQTRGLTCKQYTESEWLSGPKWLLGVNNVKTFSISTVTSDEPEIQVSSTSNENLVEDDPIVDCSRFSSFSKALRVTSYVLKFVKNLKIRLSGAKPTEALSKPILTLSDRRDAQIQLIKLYQRKFFPDIFNYLENKKGKRPNLVDQLKLYLDQGIIKSDGRLHNSSMSDACKFPILIPSECALTRLIVHDAHTCMLHSGVNDTLAYIRERWWIPRGRQVVKKILRKCVTCLKVNGKPFVNPVDPPLPADRIAKVKPFQISGVDFTGALTVKTSDGFIKAYIVLFTCAVTRAVHLEVAYSLSEEEFLRCLVKFVSRRGYPQILHSDNGTNFLAASKTLKLISESNKMSNYLINNGIVWKFITPRAAWHGGFWERLIGITKVSLKKVVGKAFLQANDLEVLVTQIESRMNDRPLTYLSSDLGDFQPLTPSQLIFGYKLREFPDLISESELEDPSFGDEKGLSKILLHRSKVLSEFWKRWQRDYLTSLRERSCSNKGQNDIATGQVVLIYDEKPRVQWKLGLITKLFPSLDEHIRSVELKTENGILRRPVSKLYPLELKGDPPGESNSIDKIARPTRRAAIKALERIREDV